MKPTKKDRERAETNPWGLTPHQCMTLRKRLAPVMADAPMRTASNDLPPVASPLGLSINQYRQQTTVVIDELVHIIESLEI